MNHIALIRSQLALLEKLVPTEILAKPAGNHPAAIRWRLAHKILRQGGSIRWPLQLVELPLLARMLLDSVTLVTVTGGILEHLTLGDIGGFGDQQVQVQLRSRIADERQFEHVMVELSLAAWYSSQNYSAIPIQRGGWPDLRISLEQMAVPLYVECKRIQHSTENRLTKEVREANSQLRTVDEPSSGSAFFHLADCSPPIGEVSDAIPDRVISAASVIRRALAGEKNRSVGAVVLTWDDYSLVGTPPERTSVVLRRRFMRLDHEDVEGVRSLPISQPLFTGVTLMLGLDFDTTLVGVDTMVFTDLMKECEKWFRFTKEEVVEAFKNREKTEPFDLGEGTNCFLFAAPSALQLGTWNLVLATRIDNGLRIDLALRVPKKLVESCEFLTPLEMLERLAVVYGCNLTFGGFAGRFISRRSIVIPHLETTTGIIGIDMPKDHPVLQSMFVRFEPRGYGLVVKCALAFALDGTRLLPDLDG
ncbi:MAG: hypothetical protein M3167_17410 [Acidobacteriota bacterium]|nr:hypothetical protein [Acidobacteriota bacterium]